MVKMSRVRRCHSCGSILQDKVVDAPGYISNDILNNEAYNESILYCDNCFRKMKALNENQLSTVIAEDILTILKDAVATDALIVWVIDAYSFSGFLPDDVTSMIKNLNVIVVATHFDLFPNSYKQDKLIDYINLRFNEAKIKPVKISIIGKNENDDSKSLFADIQLIRQGHDVYFLGSKFTGKTFLINKYLKTEYTNSSKRVVRTVKYPKTNVDILEIPFDKTSFLYELPGFPLANSCFTKVDKESLRFITPNKQIKITNITMKPKDGFAVGSLGCFLLEKGKITSFKFYSAEGTEIKRIKSGQFLDFVKVNISKKEYRPYSDNFTDFRDFDLFDFEMDNDGLYHDITILGLGWISFKALGQTIRVCAPRGVIIKECTAKIG